MNSLVKYIIRGECNIIIDTVISMNMVDEDINYLDKYMINGNSDITIDTETFII